MVSIKVDHNASELSAKISAVITKQMPYVVARTLTGLAYDVRDSETANLSKYFKIRVPWITKSLKVQRAEKSDFPNAFSIVGVRDKILAKNITGGKREGSSAIPGGAKARQLLNPTNQTLGPRFFPGRLIKTGDKTDKGKRTKSSSKFKSITKYGNAPFIFTSKRGPTAGQQVIAVRRSEKRLPIDILYVLTGQQPTIKKKWPFIENATRIVNKNYASQFDRNLSAALR